MTNCDNVDSTRGDYSQRGHRYLCDFIFNFINKTFFFFLEKYRIMIHFFEKYYYHL